MKYAAHTSKVCTCFAVTYTYSLWFQHILDLPLDGDEIADVFVSMESLVAQVVLLALYHRQLFDVHCVTTTPVS